MGFNADESGLRAIRAFNRVFDSLDLSDCKGAQMNYDEGLLHGNAATASGTILSDCIKPVQKQALAVLKRACKGRRR
jgi:hypothetical protein